MFRKVNKNKNKKRFLKKTTTDEQHEDEESNASKSSEEEEESGDGSKSKKRSKPANNNNKTSTTNKKSSLQLNEYTSSSTSKHLTEKELVTKTAEFHPAEARKDEGSQHINTLAAGPMRAPTFVRSTTMFDYQPDICKDYKQTGFCGYGDTCIYLHDRGDTLSGWQLEKQWESKKKKEQLKTEEDVELFMNHMMTQSDKNGNDDVEKQKQEETKLKTNNYIILEDDGIPFACHLCRSPFCNPIVTTCQHFFCESCAMKRYVTDTSCPICGKDTNGVFNYPQKLYTKKKKILGNDSDWNDFHNVFLNRTNNDDTSVDRTS